MLYNWIDYYPPELLQKFERDTGIRVVTDYYESNEALLASLQGGADNYDVVVPSDYMVKILIDEGLLRPIDVAGMPNFRNVRAPFDAPWYDPERRYSAPNMWGTTGFVYDAAQVSGGRLSESWKEFFSPRRQLAGKVVALDDQRELYTAAAYYLGVDPCTEDAEEAQKILDLLLAQKPKLAYYTSGTDPTETDHIAASVAAIAAREVALSQAWDGGARLLERYVSSMVYVVPREGSTFWQDAVAIPYSAPHPENAEIFVNWIMAPENIAIASNYGGYTNTITGSERYLDPILAKDQAIDVAAVYGTRLRVAQSCSPAAQELNARVWARLWPRTVK